MSPLFQLVLFNNCFIQLLIPWMSPLFQLVYSTTYSTAYSLDEPTFYSDGRPYLVALFIQQLVLFNFLFQWPPLFGRTFYSTTGFIQLFIGHTFNSTTGFIQLFIGHTFYSTTDIQQLFYSTAYSLSLIPTVLFNCCSPDGRLIQLFIPMATLIWSHFLFNFLLIFYST